MKREDVSKQIPGISKEQLDWLMAEHGRDFNAEKQRADPPAGRPGQSNCPA